ncbi:hypothetical protein [Desulfovibrio sp. Huiquan2017]|nr:hypothetical protein [Desulfovibrio sp. Huiquan2017]
MKNITTTGIDLAKNVFQLHGVSTAGKVVIAVRLPLVSVDLRMHVGFSS